MSAPEPGVQRFELRIVATGEVRDAEGNLLNQPVAESTITVTEEQARAIIESRGSE